MSLWGRLFARRPASPAVIDRRCLNEDWRPGDLAVCVSDEWEPRRPDEPRVNELLRVSAVVDGTSAAGIRAYFLCFEGKPQNHAWECIWFRKVRPQHEPAERWWSAGLWQRVKRRERA